MSTITIFAEAQAALRPFYINTRTIYNLDVMRALMEYLDNPQNKLRVMHVAGTSGKTSTAYYTAALLQQSGATVGLSVSPHVDQVNERLQINGQPLSEAEFCAVLNEFLVVIADCEVKPSYFELLVAMAFWEFARRGLDYAVMEVGLGGLLDATNVVDRPDKVCLITDIGLDHTEILGDTLDKIATQKAGIIQDGNTVLIYEQGAEVMDAVATAITNHGAELRTLSLTEAVYFEGLPLFQQHNLGLAKQAVDYVITRDNRAQLNQAQLEAVSKIIVPARLERFSVGDKTIIVDGSHNQQKLHALLESVVELFPGQDIASLVGFVKGNDTRWQGGLDELIQSVEHITFTGFMNEQDVPKTSVDPDMLAVYCHIQNFGELSIVANPVDAFNELLLRPEPVLLVTGSFYLLNHIRPLLMDLL